MRPDIIISAILQELEKRVRGMVTANHEIYNENVVFYVRYNSTNLGSSYVMTREEIRDLQYKLKVDLSADVISAVADDIVFKWKHDLIDELFGE